MSGAALRRSFGFVAFSLRQQGRPSASVARRRAGASRLCGVHRPVYEYAVVGIDPEPWKNNRPPCWGHAAAGAALVALYATSTPSARARRPATGRIERTTRARTTTPQSSPPPRLMSRTTTTPVPTRKPRAGRGAGAGVRNPRAGRGAGAGRGGARSRHPRSAVQGRPAPT